MLLPVEALCLWNAVPPAEKPLAFYVSPHAAETEVFFLTSIFANAMDHYKHKTSIDINNDHRDRILDEASRRFSMVRVSILIFLFLLFFDTVGKGPVKTCPLSPQFLCCRWRKNKGGWLGDSHPLSAQK